ncbi:uroporphyrinogen III methyltransferase [Kordiimonas sediminis]|uniref:Uroporphyrinogen-III synthase n=1 Tax=Kordiimonas sediminis TaxID=1735581 RepID=A0A919AL30_9PROT|nr:uroporphyrinogen-III synthase [Kordiimonas sediminis]GHF13049.1 uroporphyrinogen III methyltransferase [Kordiimonas sediminis]
MTSILVTRPEGQTSTTVRTLGDMGLNAIVRPLTRVEPVDFELNYEPAAVVVTSVNGALHGLNRIANKSTRVYTVGKRTAEVVREMGFDIVIDGDGTAKSILGLVHTFQQSVGGTIVHLSGETLAHDVVADLTGAGYTAHRQVCYETHRLDLTQEDMDTFQQAKISWVVFYSATALTIFEEEVGKFGATPESLGLSAHCLSERIKAASAQPWKGLTAAPYPEEFSLLASMKRMIENGGL